MPTKSIPFSGANKNADEGMQNALGWDLYNGIVDELGNLRRVPGYTSFATLMTGYGVTGLHYNEANDKVVCVSGAHVFIIEEDGTTTDVTGTGIPVIGTLCTFADFKDDVYIANGVQIIKCPMDGVTTTTYVTDVDAPTDALWIANINDYLLANSGIDGTVKFSDTGTPEVWAGEFFSFDSTNDKLQFMGVAEGTDRIYGFGTNSTQAFRNDTSTPFVDEAQEFVTRGSISRYSPVWGENPDTWYFVDRKKNLCRISGRTAQRLPTKNYRGLTAFLEPLYCEDLQAFLVYSNGYHWYVANLPTEQKSFAYNIDLDQWGEWAYYDTNKAEYQQFRAQCSTYASGWQLSLLGDSRSGTVYSMSPTTYTANSDLIRTTIRTGFINRGSSQITKFCNRISGRVIKKNVNNADGTLKVAIRWRETNLESAWQQEEVDLFTLDGLDYFYFINGLGKYTDRQWEIVVTSDIDFQMTPPMEEYDESYQ